MTNEVDVGAFDQHEPGQFAGHAIIDHFDGPGPGFELGDCATLPRSCRRRPNGRSTERSKNRRLLISELVSATLAFDPCEVICADSFDQESKHFRVGDHP